ncbi:MAG: effector binding domain-containing protein [Fimbriimonadaceae bacterium]|nr:effector binding domain-containing protein [Fimbriimonadaceae bacterium]
MLEVTHLPAFSVAGFLYEGQNTEQEIAALWGEYDAQFPHETELKFWGISRPCDGDTFQYLGGYEVTAFTPVPPNFVMWTLAPATYLRKRVHLSEIRDGIEQFFASELATQPYQFHRGPILEQYPATFDEDQFLYLLFTVEPA